MPPLTANADANSRFDRLTFIVVIAVAAATAIVLYVHHLETARLLWTAVAHDRNTHYLFGLDLALDVRQFDIRRLISDIDGARVWPPLHGILVALALLIGGLDHTIGVVPSLLAWMGTVVMTFLVARRAVSRGGNFAGIVAAIFTLASPAHRAFATDVMLESLGAFLSTLAMYLYLAAVQRPSEQRYRNLGLALTALFLTKYNYWFLAVAGMLAAEGVREWPGRLDVAWAKFRSVHFRNLALRELRQPLNYVAGGALGLMVIVLMWGESTYEIWGQKISTIKSHHNFIQVAYAAIFIRAVLWWRNNGRAAVAASGFRLRQIVRWHLWPVAIWLLLPKKLSYMLFYLSPTRAPNSPASFFWGVNYYQEVIPHDYHIASWSAVVVASLMLAAVFAVRRLKPGAEVLLSFVILAALLTIAHPNRLSRYVHTWIPSAWALAGAGAATSIFRRRANRRQTLLAAAIASLLAISNLREPFNPGRSPEAGHSRADKSLLDVTDFYLPYLEQSRHVTFFATVPAKHVAAWTFLERFHDRDRLDVFLKGFGPSPEENAIRFQKWLKTTDSDTLVFFDVPPGSRFYLNVEPYYLQYGDLLRSQTLFEPYLQHDFPACGCNASLWRRRAKTVQSPKPD